MAFRIYIRTCDLNDEKSYDIVTMTQYHSLCTATFIFNKLKIMEKTRRKHTNFMKFFIPSLIECRLATVLKI